MTPLPSSVAPGFGGRPYRKDCSAMFTLALSLLIISAPAAALLAYVAHASRQKKKYSRLPLGLVGRVGSVETTLEPEGFVLVGGELWRARLRGGGRVARGGSNVRVVGARGCLVEVEVEPPV